MQRQLDKGCIDYSDFQKITVISRRKVITGIYSLISVIILIQFSMSYKEIEEAFSLSSGLSLDIGFFVCYILNARNGSDKGNPSREDRGSAKPRDIRSLDNLVYRSLKGSQARENISRVTESR